MEKSIRRTPNSSRRIAAAGQTLRRTTNQTSVYNGRVSLPTSSRSLDSAEGFLWNTKGNGLDFRSNSLKTPSVRRMSRIVCTTSTPSSKVALSRMTPTHAFHFNHSTQVPGSSSALKHYSFKEVGALIDWNERSNSPQQFATSEKSLATTTSRSSSQAGMYRSKTLKQPVAAKYQSASGVVHPSPRNNQSLKQNTTRRTNYMSGFNQLDGGWNSQAQMSASLNNQVSVKKPLKMGVDLFEQMNEDNRATNHIQNNSLKSIQAKETVNEYDFRNISFNGPQVWRISRRVGTTSTHSPELSHSMQHDNFKAVGALMDWNERSNSPQQFATSEKSLATTTSRSSSQAGMYRSKTLKQPVAAKYQSASGVVHPSPRNNQSLKQNTPRRTNYMSGFNQLDGGCRKLNFMKHEKQYTPQRTNCMSPLTQLDGGLNSQGQMSASLNNPMIIKEPPKMTVDKAMNLLDKTNEENLISAANYIQNECLKGDEAREMVHNMIGVKKLLLLLKNDSEEVQYAAAGALRNVVYKNLENKADVKNEKGLDVILDTLQNTSEKEIKHQLAGLLWNLSSDDTIKECFNKKFLSIITNSILVPSSGLRASENPKDEMNAHPKAFLCATGCLRNLSSAGPNVRREMRTCENLIDSLVHYVVQTVASHKPNDEATENCVCVLQNLTYMFEKDFVSVTSEHQNETKQDTAPEMTNVGCFSHRRFKITKDAEDVLLCPPLIEKTDSHGAEWLRSKHIVLTYLSLVACSTESLTKQAAIGALQNLTAGKGELSKSVAIIILNENGLEKIKPVLDEDDHVKNSAVALIMNLSYFPELHQTIFEGLTSGDLKIMPCSRTITSNEMTQNLCRILTNLIQGDVGRAERIMNHADVKKMLKSQHKGEAKEAVNELLNRKLPQPSIYNQLKKNFK